MIVVYVGLVIAAAAAEPLRKLMPRPTADYCTSLIPACVLSSLDAKATSTTTPACRQRTHRIRAGASTRRLYDIDVLSVAVLGVATAELLEQTASSRAVCAEADCLPTVRIRTAATSK